MGKWAILIMKEFQWQFNNLFMRRKWLTCLHRNRSKSKQMKHFLMYHISSIYHYFNLNSNDPVKRKETKEISMHESPLMIKWGNMKLWCYLSLSETFLIGTLNNRLTNTNISETFILKINRLTDQWHTNLEEVNGIYSWCKRFQCSEDLLSMIYCLAQKKLYVS